jgi:hypothetical protein
VTNDAAGLVAQLSDGDIIDVYFDSMNPERVDFGGVETHEGRAHIVNFLVRVDCTCDWIDLDDVVDIKLVQPWTERSPEDLETNTIGAGSRPRSESSFALHGRQYRTSAGIGEVPEGTVVTVSRANPDSTAFVLTTDDISFVLDRAQVECLLLPL